MYMLYLKKVLIDCAEKNIEEKDCEELYDSFLD